jgi:hypothetical protein
MSGPKAVPAIVVDLAKGHSLSEFYPVVHPTLIAALHKLEAALVEHGDDLHLDVAPGGLAAYGETVARRFAGSATADKFRGIAWRTERTGAPVLDDALAWLDCRVTAALPGGDHTIFVGEVARERGHLAAAG